MKFETLINEWESECAIDPKDLIESSRLTSILQTKYLKYRRLVVLKLRSLYNDEEILKKNKWLYYYGKMPPKNVEELGWDLDPFDGLSLMKGDKDLFLKSDEDILKMNMRIEEMKNILKTVEDILDNLKWRHQTISNMTKLKIFEAGG